MAKKTLSALIEGGKATAGPPLGPQLGPMGVNILQIIAKINEETKSFQGMQIPVDVIIDDKTKEFSIKVGSPPASALLKKEAGIEKGSGEPNKTKVGNLTFGQIIKVADMKKSSLMSYTLKSQVKEIIGSCVPLGLTIDRLDPKEMQKKIDMGDYSELLSGNIQDIIQKADSEAKDIQAENKALQQEIAEQKKEEEALKVIEESANKETDEKLTDGAEKSEEKKGEK